MNKIIQIIILIFFLNSCFNKEKDNRKSFIETKTSFFNLNNSDWLRNEWIRKPENLKIIHETFKKIGYENFKLNEFPNDDLIIINTIYLKRNLKNLLDSLELTYTNLEIHSKYYNEFWKRRKAEKNDIVVYEIITEIRRSIFNNEKPGYETKYVNDTLFELLRIEYNNEKLDSKKAEKDFEILLKYGFHQSAYNLLFERTEYSDLKLNREILKKKLKISEEFIYPWLTDNKK